MIYKNNQDLIKTSHKYRVVCCDDYEEEVASYICYNSKEDFLDAIGEEKYVKLEEYYVGDDE